MKKPDKRGNAFIFRSDGTPVEIHHLEQSVDGPYVEMHRYDHRGKDNHKVNNPKLGQGSQNILLNKNENIGKKNMTNKIY